MKQTNFLDETVYVTFPTKRGTAKTLTEIAKVLNTTQPKLLDEICNRYIAEKSIDMLNKLVEMNVDVTELLKYEEEK